MVFLSLRAGVGVGASKGKPGRDIQSPIIRKKSHIVFLAEMQAGAGKRKGDDALVGAIAENIFFSQYIAGTTHIVSTQVPIFRSFATGNLRGDRKAADCDLGALRHPINPVRMLSYGPFLRSLAPDSVATADHERKFDIRYARQEPIQPSSCISPRVCS